MTTFSTIRRDRHGIPHIEAADEPALFFGQGRAHATDRAMQMLLLRLVGQGRVSEVLDASDDSLRVDRFFRRLNWSGNTRSLVENLSSSERAMLDAYCQGVNHALSRCIPWEFRLLRHRPEPWRPEDTVLLLRMLGYLTLAASQGEIERLFLEMVQTGVTEEKLHELFPGMRSCRAWDLPDGDAQLLATVADASFDFVHSSHVIEHVPEPGAFLAEIHRILKPGGWCVTVTPNRTSLQAALFGSGWRSVIPDHMHLFSRPGLLRLVRDSGLAPLRTATWGGIALGLAPAPLKAALDRAAKLLGFGDVLAVLARKPPAGT